MILQKESDDGGLRVTYTPNGDGPGKLLVESRKDEDSKYEIETVDQVNIVIDQRREKAVAKLPEHLHEEAGKLLLQLAAEACRPQEDAVEAKEVLNSDAREIAHPAFELGPDFLLYGFRVERVVDKRVVTDTVSVLSRRKQNGDLDVELLTSDEFDVNGRAYVLDPRWKPPLLNDVWSRDGLLQFVSDRPDDLPSPVPPSPKDVYRSIRETYERYLDYVDAGAWPILTAATILTYIARAFPAVPYLGLMGPKGTGKSAALDCAKRITFNGYKGRLTAAALGDTTSALRGTALIDQAHRLQEELVDLLVDGYRRAGGKRRVVNSDARGDPYEFETFGVKFFASAKRVDLDLEDRLVVIHTAPACRDIEQLPASDDEFRELRGSLYAMMLAHWPLFVWAAENPEVQSVRSRGDELWAPIEAVLAVCQAPEEDVEAARELYRRSSSETVAELGDWEMALLDVLNGLAKDSDDKWEIDSDVLLQAIHERLALPEDGPKPGKHWLGNQVADLNLLHSKVRKQEGGKRKLIYTFARDRVVGQYERFGAAPEDAQPAECAEAAQPAGPAQPPVLGSGSANANDGNGLQDRARLPDQSDPTLSGDTGNSGRVLQTVGEVLG